MPRPRHQRGWLTKEGGYYYGNYRRYVNVPDSGSQKKKHVVVVLGFISKLKKWEARQKLEAHIAEDLGLRQIQQSRPDPETSFSWFVQNRYLPMRDGPLASGHEGENCIRNQSLLGGVLQGPTARDNHTI